MIVVGICGPLGSGKSTFAKALANQFDNARIIPFAKPLKDFAIQLGWNGKKDAKGRRLLQLLGTDVGRDCISEEIWIDHWSVAIVEAKDDGIDLVIADDCRFENEAFAVKGRGGVNIQMQGRGRYSAHASEKRLDRSLIDFFVDNGTSMKNLELQANELYPKIVSMYV